MQRGMKTKLLQGGESTSRRADNSEISGGSPAPATRLCSVRGTEVLAVQCAWCRAWRVDAVWVQQRPAGDGRQVSHGICPRCLVKKLKELEAA